MAATISLVEATRPEALTAAAAQLQAKIAELDATIAAERAALTALAGGWEGTAADAALARGEQHILQQHQWRDRLASIQATLTGAGANLTALRAQILALAAQARAQGGLVSDDGAVNPLLSGGLMTPAVAAAYTAALKQLLQTFDSVDQDSSRAIIQALGGDPESDGDTPPERDIESLKPPDGATDTEVNEWWDRLSEEDRERLITERPEWIGNLDGIPPTARDRANRNRLETLRNDPNLTAEERATLTEIDEALAPGDRQLLVVDFDGEHPKVAIALGNVETADHVSVYVPGTGAVTYDKPDAGNDLPTYIEQSEWLKTETEAVLREAGRSGETVATIAWLGYEPPANVAQAASPHYADDNAPKLASFINGVNSSRDSDPNLTVLGHSYGSLVASEALQRGTAADNVVFMGSPGLETNIWEFHRDVTPEKLHLSEGQVFVQHADNDIVANLGRYGATIPSSLPGFIDLSTDAETTPLGQREASGGHSEYSFINKTALYNQAVVVAGLGQDERFVRVED
ncbi:alpha/beta hydrolase [Mycolicibacterium thermoresistibile]